MSTDLLSQQVSFNACKDCGTITVFLVEQGMDHTSALRKIVSPWLSDGTCHTCGEGVALFGATLGQMVDWEHFNRADFSRVLFVLTSNASINQAQVFDMFEADCARLEIELQVFIFPQFAEPMTWEHLRRWWTEQRQDAAETLSAGF